LLGRVGNARAGSEDSRNASSEQAVIVLGRDHAYGELLSISI